MQRRWASSEFILHVRPYNHIALPKTEAISTLSSQVIVAY